MSSKIGIKEAKKLINSSNGKFFSISFNKKKDGAIRNMVCRCGVIPKNSKTQPKNSKKKNSKIITVWDSQKRDYRSFDLGTLISMRINKQTYKIK